MGIKSGSEGNIFKKGLKSLKKLVQTSEEKTAIEMKTHANLIFNELSRFVTHFINLVLPYEQAHEILLWGCEAFQVEKSRQHILLTELKSNQKKDKDVDMHPAFSARNVTTTNVFDFGALEDTNSAEKDRLKSSQGQLELPSQKRPSESAML